MQAFYDERLTNDPEFINERFYALAVQQGVPKSKVQKRIEQEKASHGCVMKV